MPPRQSRGISYDCLGQDSLAAYPFGEGRLDVH
jgi:hypothetical protein